MSLNSGGISYLYIVPVSLLIWKSCTCQHGRVLVAAVFLVLLMYYGCDVSGCLKRAFPRIFSKRDVAVPAPSCHDLNNQQNELRELLPAMFRALPPALVTDHVAVDLEQGNIHYNPRTSNDANDTDDDNWQQRNIRIVPPQVSISPSRIYLIV